MLAIIVTSYSDVQYDPKYVFVQERFVECTPSCARYNRKGLDEQRLINYRNVPMGGIVILLLLTLVEPNLSFGTNGRADDFNFKSVSQRHSN